MNELQMIVVAEDLQRRGITSWEWRPGNECIWVSWGSSSCPINAYYIFRKDSTVLVDIQID